MASIFKENVLFCAVCALVAIALAMSVLGTFA